MLYCLEPHNRAQSGSPSCESVTAKLRANSQVWLADHRSNSELKIGWRGPIDYDGVKYAVPHPYIYGAFGRAR